MTTREIRAEIIELINSGMLNVPNLVKFFKTHHPGANLNTVKEEAKEIVAGIKLLN